MTDEWMSIDDAVAHVMRVENCNRRAARRKLAKCAAAGELKTIGVNDDGLREEIPVEFWQEFLKLHNRCDN